MAAGTGAAARALSLSRHLWASVNPGYIPSTGRPQCSTQRADYAWNAAEARRRTASRCRADHLSVCAGRPGLSTATQHVPARHPAAQDVPER